jgi:hypothetical protein
MFVSAQQVSSESIFDSRSDLALHESKLKAPDFSHPSPAAHMSAFADTVEVYDIEIAEEEERNIYKEVAIWVLVVGAVGYFVYTLIAPDDDETADDGNKEPPITPSISFSVPINR